ncbi:MAG: hypothetical protein WA215_00010 [Candidatus Cybelea sp.]
MRALQRSLAVLRKRGETCAITEKWNPHAHVRQDLFGFIDAVSLSPRFITAVQVVNTHLPEHIQKIRESKAALAWVLAGGKIVIHSWKLRVRNGRKVWLLEEVNVDPRVP